MVAGWRTWWRWVRVAPFEPEVMSNGTRLRCVMRDGGRGGEEMRNGGGRGGEEMRDGGGRGGEEMRDGGGGEEGRRWALLAGEREFTNVFRKHIT
jgi:hypothetical protein